jgi:predicted dithiol-disulfide oxidoreductase (DUF899 family)
VDSPEVVTQSEWLEARTALLAREKQLTRLRDELNADRRRLPMVEVEKEYRFAGPDGDLALADLFENRGQLLSSRAPARSCATESASSTPTPRTAARSTS